MVPNARNACYRYLLGESTDEERRQIEERLRLDDDFREWLRVIEYELIAAYIAGDLTLGMRESFENNFLHLRSEARLEKLRLAKLLYERFESGATWRPDVGDPLYGYFLGLLTSDEELKIKERALVDGDYRRQMEIAEHEWIAAYTLEGLASAERVKFQGSFFGSEEKLEKLRFAEAVYQYYQCDSPVEAPESASARRLDQIREWLAESVSISISPRLTWQRSAIILGVFIFMMSSFIKVGTFKKGTVGRGDINPTFQSGVEQKDELRLIRRLHLYGQHRQLPALRSGTNKPAVELPEVDMPNISRDAVVVPAWSAKELDWRIRIEEPHHPPAVSPPNAEATATNEVSRDENRNVSLGVRQGAALVKPQPAYPQNAIRYNASGPVEVQIAVAATGRVSASKAISGHLLLRKAAEKAARKWVFNPTTVNGLPVDTQLVLTFVFTVPQ